MKNAIKVLCFTLAVLIVGASAIMIYFKWDKSEFEYVDGTEKYVDSPIINNYIVPIYKKIEFPNAETRDELIEGVNKLYTNGIDKPTISISIDFIELSKTDEYKNYSYLETAHLGDTCKAIIPSLNLNYSTRIVKTVYNCNLERTINIELGIPTPNYITNQNNTLNNLKNQVSKINPDSILKEEKIRSIKKI